MTIATTTRRRFPRRGLGDSNVSGQFPSALSEAQYLTDLPLDAPSLPSGSSLQAITGQPWYVPDFFYNLQNQASPDQVYLANAQANIEGQTAAINPITAQPVPAAEQYLSQTQGEVGDALEQGYTQSTGSPIADAFNSILSNVVGTGTPATTSAFPWGTVAVVAVLAVGGYFVAKEIF